MSSYDPSFVQGTLRESGGRKVIGAKTPESIFRIRVTPAGLPKVKLGHRLGRMHHRRKRATAILQPATRNGGFFFVRNLGLGRVFGIGGWAIRSPEKLKHAFVTSRAYARPRQAELVFGRTNSPV